MKNAHSILRVDSVEVEGLSSKRVRQMLDGKIGSTVTLTNWSKHRAVTYTVTMTRSHLPCITASGNAAKLYASDMIARAHDVFHDMTLLDEALSEEKSNFEEHKLQAHAAREELKIRLATCVEEADELRSFNASLNNELQVQTEELAAYKREIYETQDQCMLLQDKLDVAHVDVEQHKHLQHKLNRNLQDVEDRMQQAIVDSKKLTLRILLKVRRAALWRALLSFKHATTVRYAVDTTCNKALDLAARTRRNQYVRLRFFTAWRTGALLERYSAIQTVHSMTLQRLLEQRQQDGAQTRFDAILSPQASKAGQRTRDSMTIYDPVNNLSDHDNNSANSEKSDLSDDDMSPPKEHEASHSHVSPHSHRAKQRVLHTQLATAQLARIFQTIVKNRDERTHGTQHKWARSKNVMGRVRQGRQLSPEPISISSKPY